MMVTVVGIFALVAIPHRAVGASAPVAAPTNPMVAAVVNLVVLAEDGEQLTLLRTQLQKNVLEVRAAIAAHEGTKPGDNATAEAKADWQQKRDELAGKFGSALGASDRFDHGTFPAFRQKIDAAKKDLAMVRTNVRATPEDDRRAADAVSRIDHAVVTILRLQTAAA